MTNCRIFWNFWKKIKFSEKIVNPDFFFCQPFKNGWRLTVLLLFSIFSVSFSLLLAVPRYQKLRKTSCFAAIFKLFALLFSNCDEFQKFFKKNLKIFEKIWNFLKIFESRDFLLPAIQKWMKTNCFASFSLLLAVPRYQKLRKTSCFAAIFKVFALLFSNFD